MKHSGTAPFTMVFVIAITSLLLVPIIAVRYAYDTRSLIEATIGFTLLLATAGFFWSYRKRLSQTEDPGALGGVTIVGSMLGLLWLIEISINNLVAPPLPLRDIIDNSFWAAIALSILVLVIVLAYRTRSLLHGIKVGLWSGLVSGLLACGTALTLIIFGMDFITQDPLNVAEWALRHADSGAPSMAAYFAFETFAGAFLHLVVLGLLMGGLLGLIGGTIGKSAGQIRGRVQES